MSICVGLLIFQLYCQLDASKSDFKRETRYYTQSEHNITLEIYIFKFEFIFVFLYNLYIFLFLFHDHIVMRN